jgi:hypothetical protein
MKFKDSKYTDPQELVNFSGLLSIAIANLQGKPMPITASEKNSEKTGLELWPLAHHTTHGRYYTYTSPSNSSPIKFWVGLDFSEANVALITWFDVPDSLLARDKLIPTIIPSPTQQYYDDFGYYPFPPVNQFWISLKADKFDQFYEFDQSQAVAASAVIEKFLEEILQVL